MTLGDTLGVVFGLGIVALIFITLMGFIVNTLEEEKDKWD